MNESTPHTHCQAIFFASFFDVAYTACRPLAHEELRKVMVLNNRGQVMVLKLIGLAAVGRRKDRLQGSMSSWLMLRTYRHPLFSVVVVAGGDDGGVEERQVTNLV